MLSANINVIKILILLSFSSIFAVLWTPFLTNFLYKYKLWRKKEKVVSIDGKYLSAIAKINKSKTRKVPRLGGVLIWGTMLFTVFLFAVLPKIFNSPWLENLNFLSRGQTWLPLAMLIFSSFLGLADDLFVIFGKGKNGKEGISFTRRLLILFLIGLIGALWFYFKLGWHSIHIPFVGDMEIGLLYIPLFIITIIACWSGGVIDGIDGLSGGALGIMFAAFSIISFSLAKYDLSAFCAVITGSILSFLWFNIPPARFYMGETGIIGLTSTLGVVAFLTDSVLILPIIGGLLVLEAGSNIIQLTSKKFLKHKIFIATPIHHHLEAKGWSPEKITMRFWVVGMVLATIGIVVRLLG